MVEVYKLIPLLYPCPAEDGFAILTQEKNDHSLCGRHFQNQCLFYYGRPWPAVYINFVLKIHQIQVLTEPLCRAQASFYALSNNERGTKYRGLTYSARQNCP